MPFRVIKLCTILSVELLGITNIAEFCYKLIINFQYYFNIVLCVFEAISKNDSMYHDCFKEYFNNVSYFFEGYIKYFNGFMSVFEDLKRFKTVHIG